MARFRNGPYITGWGDVDIVLIAARWEDSVVWGIVPGIESETMSASMLELSAVNSSSTAVITFDQHLVTTDDVTSVVPFDSWLESYRMGLRANGSLALGVTGRCLSYSGRATSMTTTPRLGIDSTQPQSTNSRQHARTQAIFVCVRRQCSSPLRAEEQSHRHITRNCLLDRRCSCSYRAKRAKFGIIS